MAKANEQDLHKELKQIADTLEEFLQSSGDKSKAEVDKLKTKAESVIKDARSKLAAAGDRLGDKLTDAGETVSAKAREASDCTNKYVHDHPWSSVGIGAAVGLVLGILLTKR